MSNSTKFEDRASSSPSTHEGEPSESLCDRLSRTRDTSQRQLPTDQDYAVSTREYQIDQSSLKTAPTAARSVLEKRRNPQQQTQRLRCLTRSLHIRPMHSLSRSDRPGTGKLPCNRPIVQMQSLIRHVSEKPTIWTCVDHLNYEEAGLRRSLPRLAANQISFHKAIEPVAR